MVELEVLSALASLVWEQAPGDPSWGAELWAGVRDFWTVERTRNTILIVLSGVCYLGLTFSALQRLVYRPTRFAVAQQLRSIARRGVVDEDAPAVIDRLEAIRLSRRKGERFLYLGLRLRADLIGRVRAGELDTLGAAALQHEAASVAQSLQPATAKLVTKPELTASEMTDLRQILVAVQDAQARTTEIETRELLRKFRKSQLLMVVGVLLIALLVILFGNPAIIAFGVLGAVISRTLGFFQASSDKEQKYHWFVLFLVPIVGGLSAYGGVVLIHAARTWGLLGTMFSGVDFGGDHANVPTLAAAFLFGFTERLLDRLVDKHVDGFATIMKNEAENEAEKESENKSKKEAASTKPLPDDKTASKDSHDAPDPDASTRHAPRRHVPRRLRRARTPHAG